ncbi:ATP-binding protein [Corynebacterium hindlerae]|uniref:ATP-binding protein n=1 Tax=Corynebacterium hindlerae TaxID=699041 RepID=UPI0031B7051A
MTLAPDPGFPFAAVVGQDQLKLALILNAISPRIGGVVVRGEKGTAKTTTVRAFAALLEGAPLVNLPLGATEDRVVGSLNVEKVFTTGHTEFQPGLLSQAHGGVLYVDEVNLLADHLIDALLDAAATGRVTVERDGISHSDPASFVLVGTMNPEEGELRPQLLDRFGLAVEVVASRDVDKRAEIMRRRLAFEADPVAFAAQWQQETAELSARIAKAKSLEVTLGDEALRTIAHVCAAFDVDGMRADLVIARAARAHAAWRGATEVAEEDIKAAAELALPHRKRRDPFDEPGLDEDQLDQALDDAREDTLEEPEQRPQEPSTQPEKQPEEPTSDGKVGSAETGAQFRT